MKDALKIGKDNVGIYTLPGEGKYIGGVSYFVHYKTKTEELMKGTFCS